MNITIDDELLRGTGITPEHALLDLAIGLFVDRRVTLGRAAAIAGLPQPAFQKKLGERQIPVHYDMDDLEADYITVSQM